MNTLIQAKVLKGFRDYLPNQEIKRALLIEKLTEAFRFYGFVPIDTPVLEYSEILLRKSEGETEKQVFRFEDNGGRDVALRFDLTVPFARFIASHKGELYFPFKRYHIAKVWRGEKPQAGRYREFMQCDFDSIGSDSAESDFEILSLMKKSLSILGVENITIRLSHRGIFNAFLKKLNLHEKTEDVLRSVDKLAKVGRDEVISQLEAISGSKETAQDILRFISGDSDFDACLKLMEEMSGATREADRLRSLRAMMIAAGIEKSFVLDPSITRGLDYYTGIVYETFLNDLPSIGSVCSGGRYDNLAGLYMKEEISGVGSSIGLDRLIAALEELGMGEEKKSFVDAIIFYLDAPLALEYQALAEKLRRENIAVEVFPEAKKMNQQYNLAEKKGIPYGIIVKNEKDAETGSYLLTLKNLETRESFESIGFEEALAILKK